MGTYTVNKKSLPFPYIGSSVVSAGAIPAEAVDGALDVDGGVIDPAGPTLEFPDCPEHFFFHFSATGNHQVSS